MTKEEIDDAVREARERHSRDPHEATWLFAHVIVALADRIAELERAAETTRAEHAAAMAAAIGLTRRAREMEAELTAARAATEHIGSVNIALVHEHDEALGLATARIRELEGEREELLGLAKTGWSSARAFAVAYGGPSTEKAADAAFAIVARIEKATK